jgi:flagellar basal-body rod modification protein FlgD
MTTTIDTQTLDSLGLLQQAAQQGASGNDKLGQADFLKLMVAQLNNQDPMKPMESGEFYTQIAQFSAVAGIQDLQTSFAQVATAMYSSQALQASAMVGRYVLAPAETSTIDAEGMIAGTVEVPASSNGVNVSVYNSAGQLVRTLGLGPQPAGTVSFVWDGKDANGVHVDAGEYKVSADSVTDGQTTALSTSIAAMVESVSLSKGGQGITLNLTGVGPVSLADVKEVM